MVGPRKSASLPKPFRRPGIDLDSAAGTVKREWQKIPAGSVVKGDTVADVGLVEATLVYSGFSGQKVLRLTNVVGDVVETYPHIEVLAFVIPGA
jgi:hypothetical protein